MMGDLIPFPPPQDPIEYCCPDCDCELFRLTSSGLDSFDIAGGRKGYTMATITVILHSKDGTVILNSF